MLDIDKSSSWEIDLEEQRRAWNQWNSKAKGRGVSEPARREWECIDQYLGKLNSDHLNIIEVGCGAGWLAEKLSKFGRVTATDLSDEVLQEASKRLPAIEFVSGDFFELDFQMGSYDVVVAKNVLSHVADQPAFIARLAKLLRPGGHLIIVTQNRPVLERWSIVPGPQPGQLRHWVSANELRKLLRPHFGSHKITSVVPVGDQGFVRLINSVRLNALLGAMIPTENLERMKERMLLGHSLLAFATT